MILASHEGFISAWGSNTTVFVAAWATFVCNFKNRWNRNRNLNPCPRTIPETYLSIFFFFFGKSFPAKTMAAD